jgi:hypothetical protein
MLSDGITERHADEQMQVQDVAQILLHSIEFGAPETRPAQGGNGNGNKVHQPGAEKTAPE